MISKLRLSIIKFLLRFEPDYNLVMHIEPWIESQDAKEMEDFYIMRLNQIRAIHKPLTNTEEALIEKKIKK